MCDEDLQQRNRLLFLGEYSWASFAINTPTISDDTYSLSYSLHRPFENGTTTNFTKGALIQLADECKRVEDVRTEDLVQTAEKSADLRLAESTAVKITPRNNNVIITFSYDNNRSRVSGSFCSFYCNRCTIFRLFQPSFWETLSVLQVENPEPLEESSWNCRRNFSRSSERSLTSF